MTKAGVRAIVVGLCGLSVVVATSRALAIPPRPSAAAKAKTGCSSAGGTVVTKVGGRRYQLEAQTRGAPGQPRTTSFTVSSGRRTLIRGQATTSPDAFSLKLDFEGGVHGARHVELTSTDGHTVAGAADGRAFAPFTTDASTAPDFVDGAKVPRLRVKGVLRRALRKLLACAAQPAPAVVRPAALFSSCDSCNIGCALAFLGCGFGTLLSAAGGAGLPTLLLNSAKCEREFFKCTGLCANGPACCPVPCAGGHGIAIGDNGCDATCSEDAVCCGGANDPNGECCGGEGGGGSFCCSNICLDPIYRCVNPATGAYCFAGPGDVCGDTSQPGLASCCGGSEPVCRDATTHLCCAEGAGEVCDINGSLGCCPPEKPYCSRGNAAGCCAEPVCCEPPSSKCGSVCCDPFTEICTDPGTSRCAPVPPEVVIDQPTSGAHLYEDTPITLSGRDLGLGICQSHPQDGHWSSSSQADSVPQAGCTVVATFHGLGARTLTLTVIGPGGTPGSASIPVTIDPKPAIVATILSPTANTAINVDDCDELLLKAYATGAPPLTLTWTWQADQMGCAPFPIPASCPITNPICAKLPPPNTFLSLWHSCGPPQPPCIGTGKIILHVTDNLSRTAMDEVAVELLRNPR